MDYVFNALRDISPMLYMLLYLTLFMSGELCLGIKLATSASNNMDGFWQTATNLR
jgi:hypothetical protein